MVIRVLLILRLHAVLIWTCSQVITARELNSTAVGDSRCILTTCNTTKANLGRAFFHHLIHGNDSFNDINEHNMCFLMHFFVEEAAYNSRSTPFSSGE
jgi:hypothetical protein